MYVRTYAWGMHAAVRWVAVKVVSYLRGGPPCALDALLGEVGNAALRCSGVERYRARGVWDVVVGRGWKLLLLLLLARMLRLLEYWACVECRRLEVPSLARSSKECIRVEGSVPSVKVHGGVHHIDIVQPMRLL